MDNLEQQLGAVLGNPEMMQQIMAMAQALGTSSPESPPQEAPPPPPPIPDIDIGMIKRLSGLAQNTGVDKNQQVLLNALCPYLSRERISKLERAMRAAKMAKLATGIMGNQGLFSI